MTQNQFDQLTQHYGQVIRKDFFYNIHLYTIYITCDAVSQFNDGAKRRATTY